MSRFYYGVLKLSIVEVDVKRPDFKPQQTTGLGHGTEENEKGQNAVFVRAQLVNAKRLSPNLRCHQQLDIPLDVDRHPPETMSLSLAERLGIPTNRAKAGESRPVSGSRKSPYDRPSPPRDSEGQWKHDKFAEVNDIAGGVLGARLFTGTPRGGSSAAGKTRVAVDSARLLRALGEANASNGSGSEARSPTTRSGSGLEIRGASTGTTVEVRELVLGTTSADVKEIFQQHGEILSHKEVKPLPPGHTPDSVTVRLKFATQKSAEAVVEAYHGQKADGRTLSVKICDAPLVQGTATLLSLGGKIDKSVDILAQPETGSKMYSDALVNDPGAIVLTQPSAPAGRDRGGRRGRGRGARGRGMDTD
ncbi:hypothetical protein RSOLAG1IB_07919 [Rhizoctonia solani AG-1 IB]|uniref:RRM domain-containing protein n=1 Tax=Thanatephorus cucumeris (strain AG1-IB / isolate 7/3/14) TaxID=1108050 RepID=A0A0B7FG54_THACB|nr:hypothetical protein RSOLAG1IB_07919 [Rhizoctonia solani AG-1 IB]